MMVSPKKTKKIASSERRMIIFIAVGIVCVCIRSFFSLYRRCDFLVHFLTMDLYRYEFAEWCPLPAKAVGEGCVGIEPLFVRRWFGKGGLL